MTRLAGYCLMMMLAFPTQRLSLVETILDLTTPEVRQRDESRTTVCSARGGGIFTSGGAVPEPELSLSVQLEWLDRRDYKAGNEVVAAIRLTNTGTKPVLIPWNPDPETVFGKKCEWPPKSLGSTALKASVNLVFTDEAGFTQFVASHGLYAILRDSGTYQKLAPNDSVLIKIWGTVGFYNLIKKRQARGLDFKLPQEFVASASFDLDDSALFLPYKTLHSKNEMGVRVVESW